MTVEELIDNINTDNVKSIDVFKSFYGKYKLKFEYSEEQGNKTHYVTEFVFKINIDHKTKTITFEG